ncbi:MULTISPECIES: peptide deformylase [Reinekea]|jgi:peptide deformylase|uniref:Peptide deformylase n=1 Tax=Reinekea forsetii TaxID=1336806 RepID=A0A2K8KX24_9GAMM|nr:MULTISPECIES: peptide deformylase [Reinekea]ATX78409.1 peptide deformylase [Reinekea forsetii]MDO7644694.1 peptide deformylase [Reinekea forsetii]
MALLEILEYPDPRLRTVAVRIDKVDDALRTLALDMIETMYEAPGIGLAASQINVHRRLVVIDVSEQQDAPLILINPEYVVTGAPMEYQEGCLSVPGYYENVTRFDKIQVSALNEQGEALAFEATDLLAICIQHEIDHLDGKLFVDYLSSLKRTRIKKKLEKQHKLDH